MYTRYIKRIVDLILALLLIFSCLWLIILIVFLYLVAFDYPILFIQQRVGKDNQFFNVYKFRTLKNTDASLAGRRFWLGNFLRFTSFDELPQLINVLKGQMSFIGPRPLPVEYLPLYSDEQRIRHSVLPGITGWAQVNGRNNILWKEKFARDIYYVHNISFTLDVKIIIKTVILILSFKKDTSLQEQKFTGQ